VLPEFITLYEIVEQVVRNQMRDQLFECLSDGRSYTVKVFDVTHVEDYYHIFALDALCVLNDKDEAKIGDYVWLLEIDEEDAEENTEPLVVFNNRIRSNILLRRVLFKLNNKVFSSWKRIV